MAENPVDMTLNELDELAERITKTVAGNIGTGRELFQRLSEYDVFSAYEVKSQAFLQKLVYLSLITTCLDVAVQGMGADGELEENELDVAYEYIGPLARYYSKTIENVYSKYIDLERSHILDFLSVYTKDKGDFGGALEASTRSYGGVFALIGSCLEGTTECLDSYDLVTSNILNDIVRVGGIADGEREVLKWLRAKTARLYSVLEGELASRLQNEQGTSQALSEIKAEDNKPDPKVALKSALDELQHLVGLASVKLEVSRLASFLEVQQERRKHGMKETVQTLHFVFTGNPGTGKTTVARIIGKILYGFGFLGSVKLTEADRSALIGGYVGQTEIKTSEIIMKSLDGVLFIDEAYALSESNSNNDYGKDAINVLLKKMEDYRSRLTVIVAGYTEPMRRFIQTNPGLQSRFTRSIHFDDYSVSELCEIFFKLCKESQYSYDENTVAYLFLLFTLAYLEKDEHFGNARLVRNLFEESMNRQSERLVRSGSHGVKGELAKLQYVDLPIEKFAKVACTDIRLEKAMWSLECQGCKKLLRGTSKFLNKKITCKTCNSSFLFLPSSMDLNTVEGLPRHLVNPQQLRARRSP